MSSAGIIAFTQRGIQTAQAIGRALEEQGCTVELSAPARLAQASGVHAAAGLGAWCAEAFCRFDALVFVGAVGIAVRGIAPHLAGKSEDPAVVAVDEAGRFAIPLVSGHIGGANQLARCIAQRIGATAVVTTATDGRGLFAVDEWAARSGLAIKELGLAKAVAAALLEGQAVGFQSAFPVGGALPEGLTSAPAELGILVSLDEGACPFPRTLHLVPRVLTLGIGCRRGASAEAVEQAVAAVLEQHRLSPLAVGRVASIDLKSNEPALHALVQAHGWELAFYTAEQLNALEGEFSCSAFVQQTAGVDTVCERAAVCGGGELLVRKTVFEGVTVAAGARPVRLEFPEGGEQA